jgi:hypothetical protein
MTNRIRAALVTAMLIACLAMAAGGCGKKTEPPAPTAEEQQLRAQKKGD